MLREWSLGFVRVLLGLFAPLEGKGNGGPAKSLSPVRKSRPFVTAEAHPVSQAVLLPPRIVRLLP